MERKPIMAPSAAAPKLTKKTKLIIASVSAVVAAVLISVLIWLYSIGWFSAGDTEDSDDADVTYLTSGGIDNTEEDVLASPNNPKTLSRRVGFDFTVYQAYPNHKLKITAANSNEITDVKMGPSLEKNVNAISLGSSSYHIDLPNTDFYDGSSVAQGTRMLITFKDVPTSFLVKFDLPL